MILLLSRHLLRFKSVREIGDRTTKRMTVCVVWGRDVHFPNLSAVCLPINLWTQGDAVPCTQPKLMLVLAPTVRGGCGLTVQAVLGCLLSLQFQ